MTQAPPATHRQVGPGQVDPGQVDPGQVDPGQVDPPGMAGAPWVTDVARRLIASVESVVRGRGPAVEHVVVAALAGGHVLVEDLPGTGKTTLARSLARSVAGSFQRIQGTADLLPADITGSSVFEQSSGSFRFVAGPVFAHVLLVDEINRTPPRTQAAFLEVMEEHAVTVDGHRHVVPDPFFLIATQNPVEQHGTYPLPESQLDRFMVRVRFAAIPAQEEMAVVRDQLRRATVDDLTPVIDVTGLAAARAAVREGHVADQVLEYAVNLTRATRDDQRLRFGASSRAALALVHCAQARAVLNGREYVTPADVKTQAVAVLGHRVGPASLIVEGDQVVADLVQRFPVPIHP
jgi:MoxR-like ATPase